MQIFLFLVYSLFVLAQLVYASAIFQTVENYANNAFEEHVFTLHSLHGQKVKRSLIELDPRHMLIGSHQLQIVGVGQEIRNGHGRVRRAGAPPPPPAGDTTTTAAPLPELRPDEIAADPTIFVPTTSNDKPLPKIVTPNVTCILADDMKNRLRFLTSAGFQNNRPSCPKKLPCQKYTSCTIWRTGFIKDAKSFAIEQSKADEFYAELFNWLDSQKIQELMANWKECVQYYGLDKPFTGKSSAESEAEHLETRGGVPEAVGHVHAHAPKKKKRRKKTKRQADPPRDDDGVETTTNPGEETDSATPAGPSEDAGLTDCRTRIEDYLECFDTIMIKGLCYWPSLELV